MHGGIFCSANNKMRERNIFTKNNWHTFLELARANFKVNDRNCVLGIFWSLLGPATLLAITYVIFRIRFGQEIRAYPLYLLIGIITVSFFITATTYLIKIFFLNRELILNSTVPREIIILSNLSVHTYKFVIELFICLAIAAVYKTVAWKYLILLVPLFLAFLGFVLGVGIILSLLFCFARDIEHIWMIISRLLFFATPVFYRIQELSSGVKNLIYWGNPLTPFMVSFRQILMTSINFANYFYSLALGFLFFIIGYRLFIAFEGPAAERA